MLWDGRAEKKKAFRSFVRSLAHDDRESTVHTYLTVDEVVADMFSTSPKSRKRARSILESREIKDE